MSLFIPLKFATAILAIGVSCFANTASAHDRYYSGNVYPVVPISSYSYVYYPAAQVYYAPSARTWYWNDGYAWRAGYALPYGLNIDFRLGGIPISLRSALPYREHHYVDSYYGRPWRARQHFEHRREREEYREQWNERGRGYDRYEDRGGRR